MLSSFAVFYAYSQDPDKIYTKFYINKDMEKLPFSSSEEYMNLYKKMFNLENDYDVKGNTNTVKIFVKNPDGSVSVKKSDSVANTKSINFEATKNKAIKEIADAFRAEHANLDPNSEEFLNKLELEIRRYIDQNNITTQQAWEYISELLSAATDNAKEFILGRIGADMSTSGIIANMLMLGFDLTTAIGLINDPVIQNIYKISEATRELNYNGKQFIS